MAQLWPRGAGPTPGGGASRRAKRFARSTGFGWRRLDLAHGSLAGTLLFRIDSAAQLDRAALPDARGGPRPARVEPRTLLRGYADRFQVSLGTETADRLGEHGRSRVGDASFSVASPPRSPIFLVSQNQHSRARSVTLISGSRSPGRGHFRALLHREPRRVPGFAPLHRLPLSNRREHGTRIDGHRTSTLDSPAGSVPPPMADGKRGRFAFPDVGD